jgi:hypothetical protein
MKESAHGAEIHSISSIMVQIFNLCMNDDEDIHSTPSMMAQSFALHN